MYINRSIENLIKETAKHFPVVMLCGARQIGKTTLLQKICEEVPDVTFVTLDHPRLRALAKEDPELFLNQYKTPLVIDEIQYATELLSFIKMRVDADDTPGQYYLTGSQMFRMMQGVSESLAGRAGILSMYSLSAAEIEGRTSKPFLPSDSFGMNKEINVEDMFNKIYMGGMPRLIKDSEMNVETFFSSYLQTYIERDIRDIIKVKDEGKFLKFISCVAARTAQEINLSDIGSDVGIDGKTAESWLSVLVSSGLVYLMPPFSGNTIKRIVKRPKLYFMDTGLCCYLSMWNNPKALSVSAMAGAMFETYVISEIIKSYANAGLDTRSRLCYYRDNSGKEIDLIIIENGMVYPVEIKKNADPGKDALKNFSVLQSLNMPIGDGAVVCMSSMTIPLDGKNRIIPVTCI